MPCGRHSVSRVTVAVSLSPVVESLVPTNPCAFTGSCVKRYRSRVDGSPTEVRSAGLRQAELPLIAVGRRATRRFGPVGSRRERQLFGCELNVGLWPGSDVGNRLLLRSSTNNPGSHRPRGPEQALPGSAAPCLRAPMRQRSAFCTPARVGPSPTQLFADFFVALLAASRAEAFAACFSARDAL